MFEILKDNYMVVVKGDTAMFDITLDNYTFTEGDRVYFTVKKRIKDSQYVIQRVVDVFEETTARVYLTTEDTNIESGIYIYDIQVSLTNGVVDTIVLPSKFEILEGVTCD